MALLAGCADMHHPVSRNSDTVYLQDGSAWRPVRQPAAVSPKRNRPPTPTTPPPRSRLLAPTTPAPVRSTTGTTAPAKPTNPAVDSSLSARRAQLLKRVEALSHDDADSVCLTMQLVPREQIFDHSVQPKKILLHYTSQATSEADLDFLERVLNDRR